MTSVTGTASGSAKTTASPPPQCRKSKRLATAPAEDETMARQRARGHRGIGDPQRECGHEIQKCMHDAGGEHRRADEPRRGWYARRDGCQQQREVVGVQAGRQPTDRPEADPAGDCHDGQDGRFGGERDSDAEIKHGGNGPSP